jgi:hypothetical protein
MIAIMGQHGGSDNRNSQIAVAKPFKFAGSCRIDFQGAA